MSKNVTSANTTFNGSTTTSTSLIVSSTPGFASMGSLVSGNSGTFSQVFGTANPPKSGKYGWPKRHTRRCWWYYRLIRTTYHLNIPGNDDKLFKTDPLNNPRYWSDHELEIMTRIRKDLADLYNNRFIEYKKMVAEEKGYELPEIVNTNKFIMK